MAHNHPRRWHPPFLYSLCGFLFMFLYAFVADSPRGIARGLWAIATSRSTVGTDYITTGGAGAATANAALVGIACLLLMVACRVKPNGAILMAVWMSAGFGFFGVNLFNAAPVTFGVWLYSRFQKEPFINFSITALLACTLAPVASDIARAGRLGNGFTLPNLFMGLFCSVALGFLLPILAAATTRVHSGYNLYNLGFAGGVLAVFLSALRKSTAEYILPEANPSSGNNLYFTVMMAVLMAGWAVPAFLHGKAAATQKGMKKIHSHSGRLVTDYFLLYEQAAYLNMSLLGVLGTAAVLLVQGQLDGSALAGIFAMMGFGAFGKHLRNCLPVMAGAFVMSAINLTAVNSPGNVCAMLFATGLAPIAGQYGMVWGFVAGMLHMGIVSFTGTITGGLNLFNNGFAAGFVALLLVPVILAFKRGKKINEA